LQNGAEDGRVEVAAIQEFDTVAATLTNLMIGGNTSGVDVELKASTILRITLRKVAGAFTKKRLRRFKSHKKQLLQNSLLLPLRIRPSAAMPRPSFHNPALVFTLPL
jgi:hypothetical protein